MVKRSRLKRGNSKARSTRLKAYSQFDLDVEQTKIAYADSFGYPKGAKFGSVKYNKWWNEVSKRRNLQWTGTNFYKPNEWLKIARLVGAYNEFTAKNVYDRVKDLPVELKLAREGSVAVYVHGDEKTLNEVADRFKDYADEIDIVAVPHMVLQKHGDYQLPLIMTPEPKDKRRYLRLWFD